MRIDTGLPGVIPWIIFAAAWLVGMQGGLTAMHAGLMRPKNTVNVAATKLADLVIATLTFWLVGYAFMFGATAAGWIGHSHFLLGGAITPQALAQFAVNALLCATATSILSGALGERMSFRGYLGLAAFFSAIVYPIFGHWAWARDGMRPAGWLLRTGFVDYAGATTVHSVAGWAALAGLLCIGNRSGRYARSGKPLPLGRTSAPLATAGLFVVWIAWLGAMGTSAASEPAVLPTIILVALLGSAAGGAVATGANRLLRGRVVDLETAIRGVLAGLCAVSAAPQALEPALALAVGAVAGLVMLAVDELLVRLRIDDAVGAVPAHLGGGVTGTLAIALVGDLEHLGTGLHPLAQLAVQIEGAAVCAAWAFGATFLFCRAAALAGRLHVAPDEEFIGLNVSEHETGSELMDLMDALEVTALHETPFVYGEPFAEVANVSFAGEGAVRRVNPAACAIFGYGEAEMRKITIDRLFADPADLDALRGDGEDDGAPRELRGLRRTGEEFPMEIAVVAGEGGERDTLAIKDITARKESEESVTRAQDVIRRRLERELAETRVVSGGVAADVELPGADVSLALPQARFHGKDWFGWFHDPSAKAITLYAGEMIAQVRGGAAALLSSVMSLGGNETDYTHGLLLGDARYSPERQVRNLAEVLGRIVGQEGRGEITMTMSFAHVDLGTGTMTFVSAGRRVEALLRTGKTIRELGGGGTPLGSGTPELATTQVSLAANDMLLLFGDGLVDTVSPDGSILRLSEIKKILLGRTTAQEVCDEVVARARAVWKEEAQEAHAVLVLKWVPASAQ